MIESDRVSDLELGAFKFSFILKFTIPRQSKMFSLFRGVYSWFLDLFGLNNKSGRILFLGLDFAGKTTLLHLLKTGKFTASAPTHYGSTEVGRDSRTRLRFKQPRIKV